MIKFKLLSILIVLVAICVSSCGEKCIEPSGAVITDNRDLEVFSGVDIHIPATVKIIAGGSPSISIKAQESYVNSISTTIGRNTLKIKGNLCTASNADVEIIITTKQFSGISISGSASVNSDTPLRSDDLELAINGSGNMLLSVFTRNTYCNVDGSGLITLNGTSQKLDVRLNGSGEFNGLGFNSFKAKVKINGSGNASIVTHDKLSADIVGSGNINYSGDPKIDMSISGSGKLNKIN